MSSSPSPPDSGWAFEMPGASVMRLLAASACPSMQWHPGVEPQGDGGAPQVVGGGFNGFNWDPL